MKARLSGAEIASRLSGLASWRYEGHALWKEFRLKRFRDAVSFVNRVADLAEAADHHPDIRIRYTKVRLDLTTHSEGGVTNKDFELAGAIERVFASLAGRTG